jgi:hypothetical protein
MFSPVGPPLLPLPPRGLGAVGPLFAKTFAFVLPRETTPSAAFVYAILSSYETVIVTVPTLAKETK